MKLKLSRIDNQWLIHQKSSDGNISVGKISFTRPTNPVILLFNEEIIVQVKQLNEISKITLTSNGKAELVSTMKQSRQLNKIKWNHPTNLERKLEVIQKNNQYLVKQKDNTIAQMKIISSTTLSLEILKEGIFKPAIILGSLIPILF